LVSLDLLNQRGVHWNSEYPTKLVRDGSDFLNLQRVDRHWVIQTTTNYGSFATKSKLAPRAQVTTEQMYRNLADTNPEVIAQKASRDTVVNGTIQASNTIQCETYSVSKATEQINYSTETENLTNGLLLDRTNDERVDKVPASLESGDQLLTPEATPPPKPENIPDDTLEPESINQQTSELSRVTDNILKTPLLITDLVKFDGNVDSKQLFVISNDPAFTDDLATRYSPHGYVFSLYDGLINWKSRKRDSYLIVDRSRAFDIKGRI